MIMYDAPFDKALMPKGDEENQVQYVHAGRIEALLALTNVILVVACILLVSAAMSSDRLLGWSGAMAGVGAQDHRLPKMTHDGLA